MSKNVIAIVGAGRVGTAAAKIIKFLGLGSVLLVDSNQEALDRAAGEASPAWTVKTSGEDNLFELFQQTGTEAVICTTPFEVNVSVARAAARSGAHYIDFTEDNAVTSEVAKIATSASTFVQQTGLAPGLVTYVGLSLFKRLGKPKSLKLRVGALPRTSLGPEHYAVTWSVEGLINEYIRPALLKLDGQVQTISSMSCLEHLMVNGTRYEAFSTSGGVGILDAYGEIPNVEYKTIRYPGHLSFIATALEWKKPFTELVRDAKSLFKKTRDDVVVLVAIAEDEDGNVATYDRCFYRNTTLDLTALELTTAGTGVAVLELALAGKLPRGSVLANQIALDDLHHTRVFESALLSTGL